ncbi:MAG: hypothetical protein KF752_14420 [Pirellulaceae bacterium]|nr:hypothetical protein [Pirellulaceae bacterium]
MQFLRRYWIAGLVLLLVLIHGVIIGYIRSEAKQVKITASNEIPIGVYYIPSSDRQWMSQMRIHVLAKRELRLSAKATIELHRWLIHESIEECLRQLDPALLTDPALVEVKSKVKSVIEETLQDKIVERIVINDRIDLPLRQFQAKPAYDLTTVEPIYEGKPIFQRIKPSDEVEVR